jgi:hypothetical protein
MKNVPIELCEAGLALIPQNINTTRILGETIEAPWKKGRFLSFQVIGGAFAAADTITVRVEGRIAGTYNHGTTTTPSPYLWEAVQDKDGNDLAFDDQDDTDALENGHLFGTIDLNRLSIIAQDDESQYDALRLTAINDNAANVVVGATYRITDLFENPGSQSYEDDQLLSKQFDLGSIT